METKTLMDILSDTGCGTADVKRAKVLCEGGDPDALIRHLRRLRCDLIDEMHKSQRRVDLMDSLIRQTQKEAENRS